MIIRRRRKQNSNYWKAIPSLTAEDRELSLEARGLLMYILVKPDDWQLKTEDLLRAGFVGNPPKKTGKQNQRLMTARTLRRLLTELENAGYICRHCENTKRGAKWFMDAYDVPVPSEERTSQKGRTIPKKSESPSVNMCNLGSPKNTEPKLHMPELQHVTLGLEKKRPSTTDKSERSSQARKLQKHETDLNMRHVRSNTHVSISSAKSTQANFKTRKKRGGKSELEETSLPEDLEIDAELIEWAKTEAPDINLFRVVANFKDHARDKGRKSKDWIAALHAWCRTAQEFLEKGSNRGAISQHDVARGYELLNAAQTT